MKSVEVASESGISRIEALGMEMTAEAHKSTISGRINAIAALEAYALGRSLALYGSSYARIAQQLLQPMGKANTEGSTEELGAMWGAQPIPGSKALGAVFESQSLRPTTVPRKAPHRQNKQKGQPVAADPNTTTKLIASLGYAFTYFAVAESDAELARDLTDMGQDEGTVANRAYA